MIYVTVMTYGSYEDDGEFTDENVYVGLDYDLARLKARENFDSNQENNDFCYGVVQHWNDEGTMLKAETIIK